jgi:DNA invertase Pin-like site-specific DNA recombinase
VVNRLHDLQAEGINVRTLDGLLNTAALGKMAPLVIGLLTGLAEVERNLIRERTQENVDHRRALGKDLGGRRRTYTDAEAAAVRAMREDGKSLRTIAKDTGLTLSKVQRMVVAS